MTVHDLIAAAVATWLGGLLFYAFGRDELNQLRAWWRERRPPSPWTGEELRQMRADLTAARSKRDRRRNPRREYRRRQHLRAAGFRFAGGPMAALP